MRLPRLSFCLRPSLLLCALVLLAACGDSAGGPPRPTLQSLEIVSGNAQVAIVGSTIPLRVRAIGSDGRPLAGQRVFWEVTEGYEFALPWLGVTNADGIAEYEWPIGIVARQPQRAEAYALGAAGSPPLDTATFTAIAAAGPAEYIDRVSGDAQTAIVGTSLANPLVVRARDFYWNAVEGATITWSVEAGGGSVTPAQSLTDANGEARATWTLGPVVGAQAQRAGAAAPNVISGGGFVATGMPAPPPPTR